MADFAAFGEAIGQSLEIPPGTVLSNYIENRQEAAMAQLEDSPLADALLENGPDVHNWYGTPSKLLELLNTLARHGLAASPRWPQSASRFAIELRRIAPQLRLDGIHVNLSRCRKGRIVTISLDP